MGKGDKMKFHYGDKIEVIGGFHKGRKGKVIDCFFFPSCQIAFLREYVIKFGIGGEEHIKGKYLKLIK